MSRTPSDPTGWSVDQVVRDRYARGAESVQPELCCPTRYDERYLEILPEEIVQKDYGCGDPSRFVGEGERVLDLGSGAGKICYILSQVVGAEGSVVGVDFNDPMLEIARRWQAEMSRRIGYDNVSFRKGRIQDLGLDLERAQTWLADHPVSTVEEHEAYLAECDRLRRDQPMIPDDSVDAVVSNCVLNLVAEREKAALFAEIHRVLRRGGRAVISDIVCDEPPTEAMRSDPELWAGCIAGAFTEEGFLERFERAGFYGIEVVERAGEPWRVIDGIEFRSMSVRAVKGEEGPCLERNQGVVYRGPWKQVLDDDGHTLIRGRRMAVCDKTYRILTDPEGPYGGEVIGIEPRAEVPPEEARPFPCDGDRIRHPRESKGEDYVRTTEPPDPDGSCC